MEALSSDRCYSDAVQHTICRPTFYDQEFLKCQSHVSKVTVGINFCNHLTAYSELNNKL